MKDDIAGWYKNWTGPRDFRCEVCHCGFMPDERVFIAPGEYGLPYHEYCVELMVHRNRLRKGAKVIHPNQRNLEMK